MTDRNEHFQHQVSMLGVTQQVHPKHDQSGWQAMSEAYWRDIDPAAGKTISEQGAKDLVGETLHHPAMDEVQGIGRLRNEFDPNAHVRLVDSLPNDALGHLESNIWGGHMMRLAHTSDIPLRAHVVTHETAHLLSNPALSPVQWANIGSAQGIGHSWAMARMHVLIARTALGDEAADNLRSIYRAHGVGFGRRNI